MKKRKNLLFAIVILVLVAGSVTTWAISRANSKPATINSRYLEAFFQRYVTSLGSQNLDQMMSFYSPDATSVMAWGVEMNNEARRAYYAACSKAFPNAQFHTKRFVIEPTSVTSGYVTWEFGIKSGPQMAPFMGVYKKVESTGKEFDQEGVSTGQVALVDPSNLGEIKKLEDQVAALDKEIISVDEQIAALNEQIGTVKGGPSVAEGTTNSAERFALAEKRSELAQRRETADQQLLDKAVSSIKFTRQNSFQNMDAFLKKIGGK